MQGIPWHRSPRSPHKSWSRLAVCGTCLQRRLWAKITKCTRQWFPAFIRVSYDATNLGPYNFSEECLDMLRYSKELKESQRYLKRCTVLAIEPYSSYSFCVVFRPARSFPRETSKGQHRIWDILRTEISNPHLKKFASRTTYGREADVLVLSCFSSATFPRDMDVSQQWLLHNRMNPMVYRLLSNQTRETNERTRMQST